MLNWGHSYCQSWLLQLFTEKSTASVIQCPTCMSEHRFNSRQEIDAKVATNYSLIRKGKQIKDAKSENCNLGNINEDDHDNENFNIELEPHAKCPKHELPIHSYIKTNKVLLWSKWIDEAKIDKAKIKQITQVVKETRGSMNSHKLKLNQSLLQLKRFKEHIENIKEENRKKVIESVSLHFKKIYKIVKNAEQVMLRKLDLHLK